MISRDEVVQWLDDAPASDVEELELWFDDIEFGEQLELSLTDLDVWWERLGRDGERLGDDDDPALVGIEFREHLVASSRNPVGAWEAELIADQVDNAFVEYGAWAGLDATAADAALKSSLSGLVASSDALLARVQQVRLISQGGRIGLGEVTESGKSVFVPLDRVRTHRNTDKHGTYRWYNDYRLPEHRRAHSAGNRRQQLNMITYTLGVNALSMHVPPGPRPTTGPLSHLNRVNLTFERAQELENCPRWRWTPRFEVGAPGCGPYDGDS